MRIERLLLSAAAVLGMTCGLVSTASAQFFTPYLSNEQIELATQTAKDSLGSDALMVGIATAGVIDLGNFGTYDGFNIEDGKSTAWGYQFLTPSGDDGFVVGVVDLIIGGPQTALAERGNDFGLQPKALDLSGAYSNSDAFVAQLKKNATFNGYMTDYPDAVAEGIVLSWEVDGQDFLPNEFPLDKPIWAIYFNTNTDTPNDSTMVCFVASGTGESHCVRAEISSGVKEEATAADALRLTVAPNPARESGTGTLHIRSAKSNGTVQEVGVYDMVGAKVIDLTDHLVPDADGQKAEFSLGNFPSGDYVCRVVQGGKVSSVRFVVE